MSRLKVKDANFEDEPPTRESIDKTYVNTQVHPTGTGLLEHHVVNANPKAWSVLLQILVFNVFQPQSGC